MATPRLIAERFKGPTRLVVNPVTGTVGTTFTLILKNNPDRLMWMIVNLSDNRGFVGFDQQVGPGRGVPIEASGGVVSANWREDAELVIHPVYAVNLVAEGTYYVIEVERC